MNTAPLFSRDLGGAGRPPLVLLHGLLGSSRNWQAVGRELAGAFHVFALDLRNHGASPGAEPMSYEAMRADVIAWMDGHGLAGASLLGHSLGGKVAMLAACRNPGRIERLAVVDIAPVAYHWPERPDEIAALLALDLSTLRTRAEAEARLAVPVPDLFHRKFLLTNLEREGAGWRWLANLPVLAAALPELEQNPLASSDRYAGPALFITGRRSHYVPASAHAAIREHFPSARIEIIPSAGHNPHLEAREAFVRLVLSAWTKAAGT